MADSMAVSAMPNGGLWCPPTRKAWFMSAGSYHSTAVAVVPMQVARLGARMYLSPEFPQNGGKVQWAIIDDLGEWECWPAEWRSPLYDLLDTDSFDSPAGIRARPTADPRPLLEDAAWHAFDNLSATTQRELARHIHCPMPAGSDLYQMLVALIRFVLPALTEATLCSILASRVWEPKIIEPEFFELDGVRECFEEGDLDEVDRYVKGEKGKVDMKFRQSYQALVQKVRGTAARARSAPSAGASSSSSSSSRAARAQAPQAAGEFSQEEAQAFFLEGARASRRTSRTAGGL